MSTQGESTSPPALAPFCVQYHGAEIHFEVSTNGNWRLSTGHFSFWDFRNNTCLTTTTKWQRCKISVWVRHKTSYITHRTAYTVEKGLSTHHWYDKYHLQDGRLTASVFFQLESQQHVTWCNCTPNKTMLTMMVTHFPHFSDYDRQ